MGKYDREISSVLTGIQMNSPKNAELILKYEKTITIRIRDDVLGIMGNPFVVRWLADYFVKYSCIYNSDR